MLFISLHDRGNAAELTVPATGLMKYPNMFFKVFENQTILYIIVE